MAGPWEDSMSEYIGKLRFATFGMPTRTARETISAALRARGLEEAAGATRYAADRGVQQQAMSQAGQTARQNIITSGERAISELYYAGEKGLEPLKPGERERGIKGRTGVVAAPTISSYEDESEKIKAIQDALQRPSGTYGETPQRAMDRFRNITPSKTILDSHGSVSDFIKRVLGRTKDLFSPGKEENLYWYR